MPKTQHLDAGLSLRMSHADRTLFNEAARISGRSVGQTLVICARPTAQQIVAEETGRCPCQCRAHLTHEADRQHEANGQ